MNADFRLVALAASGTAALTMLAPAALGADLYRGRAPAYTVAAPLNTYSWAGPYIGANLGYQWGRATNSSTRPSGLTGGIQAGYNFQSGALVFGGELDAQLTGADDLFAGWKFTNPWFGTARARIGYAMNNVLIYGTAGLALGTLRAETMLASESRALGGYTAGIGAEFGMSQSWSVKAEYLYVNLADRNFALTGLGNGYQFNVLRVGVNYHF